MPINRNRRFPTRRSPNRSWASFINTSFGNVPAASKVLLGSFGLSNPNIDETILRTVGQIATVSDQTIASEQQIGAFGMIVVNDRAITAGVASIPGPATDAGDDGWFVYVPFTNQMRFNSAIGVDEVGSFNVQFNSKAKRKVQEGFAIAVVVENIHATHGFNFNVVLRLLSMISGT